METMKNNFAREHNTEMAIVNFGNEKLSEEIKIVDFLDETENGRFVISLYSPLFAESNLKVFVRDNKVVLFITEYVEPSELTNLYVSDWHSFYPQSYTRMRNVSLELPGDDFFLMKHILVPEKSMLKIILGQLTDSSISLMFG